MGRIPGAMAALGVAVLGWGCGDSTGTGTGDAAQLIVDPQDVFVSQGSDRTVLIRAVDGVGAAMDATVIVDSVGPGISVAAAPGYAPPNELDGALEFQTLNRELALSVMGEQLTRTSFGIATEGREAGVTVTVLPEGRVPVQFSGAELRLGDTLVLDVSAPLRFGPDFQIVKELNSSGCRTLFPCPGFRTLDVSADGRRATVLPLEDFSGRIELEGMSLDYADELSLRSVPEADELRVVLPARPIPGTNDTASAPSIAMPLPGEAVTLIDAPPAEYSGGEFSKYYRLVAAQTASFNFELFSPSGSYDVYLLDDETGDWNWLASNWSAGQRPLFSGTYVLKITAGPCCTYGYVRLEISAAPQGP